MAAEWHWYKFEFTFMGGSIHCGRLAKLKSDPGLCSLSQVALKGHNTQEKLSTSNLDLENYIELERDVHEGKLAENHISNYVHTILTAVNSE